MEEGLTPRDVALAIQDWQESHGYCPTVRDIGRVLQRTPSTIHAQLERARDECLVTWEPGKTRTLRCLRRL